MKKTFLISLFLLFTSSVFAVSIPGGGLGTGDNFSDNYFYFEGIGLRSMDQVGNSPFVPGTTGEIAETWQGSWDTTGGGGKSAVDAMGKSPSAYLTANFDKFNHHVWYPSSYDIPDGTPIPPDYQSTFDQIVADITAECTQNEGDELDCQNYAVDVYNLALPYFAYSVGQNPSFIGYFMAPVSTDVALMAIFAGAYLAFALWRKKRSMAKI